MLPRHSQYMCVHVHARNSTCTSTCIYFTFVLATLSWSWRPSNSSSWAYKTFNTHCVHHIAVNLFKTDTKLMMRHWIQRDYCHVFNVAYLHKYTCSTAHHNNNCIHASFIHHKCSFCVPRARPCTWQAISMSFSLFSKAVVFISPSVHAFSLNCIHIIIHSAIKVTIIKSLTTKSFCLVKVIVLVYGLWAWTYSQCIPCFSQ